MADRPHGIINKSCFPLSKAHVIPEMPDTPIPPLPPTPVHPAVQAALDADHLRLLEIGFLLSGIVTALRFLWLLFIAAIFAFAGIGGAIAAHHSPHASNGSAPPLIVFFIFAGVFATIVIFTLIYAAFEIYAGICLKNRRHPLLIQIVAAFSCLSIPWGTALGVFTFMVLNRPSVRPLFERPPNQL